MDTPCRQIILAMDKDHSKSSQMRICLKAQPVHKNLHSGKFLPKKKIIFRRGGTKCHTCHKVFPLLPKQPQDFIAELGEGEIRVTCR